MAELTEIAPAFVEMAHRIVWATIATVDIAGNPSTRILHPVWEWDGTTLTGWIATSPRSPKAAHLAARPTVALTYWDPTQDTCNATCRAAWETSDEQRQTGWDRFAQAPPPVGYVPSIVPQWTSPSAADFGILRLEPTSLRLMDGTFMFEGRGRLLTWHS